MSSAKRALRPRFGRLRIACEAALMPQNTSTSFGLIFLKYVSDVFAWRHEELERLVDD
jgi:hypothetical protein